MIDFGVLQGEGLTRNALLNRANADAAYKQSDLEHYQALNKYVTPGMTGPALALAKAKGEVEEKFLPKYYNDTTPRRDINPSSSFIENVKYEPSLGITTITIGGNQYYYPMTPDEVGDFLTSDSLGQYYNRNVKLK